MDGTDDMDADDEEDDMDPRELKRQRRAQEEGDAEFPDEVRSVNECLACNSSGLSPFAGLQVCIVRLLMHAHNQYNE